MSCDLLPFFRTSYILSSLCFVECIYEYIHKYNKPFISSICSLFKLSQYLSQCTDLIKVNCDTHNSMVFKFVYRFLKDTFFSVKRLMKKIHKETKKPHDLFQIGYFQKSQMPLLYVNTILFF